MIRPSRRMAWVSALDPAQEPVLNALQSRMTEYYSKSGVYFAEIDFTKDNWRSELSYLRIAEAAMGATRILEVGCGRANILEHYPELEHCYTGVDFSPELAASNARRFPKARFLSGAEGGISELEPGEFDLVFSVFVLEHCVFPQRALGEWLRVLEPRGRFILMCPEFLGSGWITSQRLGFSSGTGREKWARGDWHDALVTALDSRIRMRWKCWWQRSLARASPRFLVNLAPVCFEDPFGPDVDAVYVAYGREIFTWLSGALCFREDDARFRDYLVRQRLVFVDGRKRS